MFFYVRPVLVFVPGLNHLVMNIFILGLGKRQEPKREVKQDDPQLPQILTLRIIFVSKIHLWRAVRLRPRKLPRRFVHSRKSKVSNLNAEIVSQVYIFELEIPMSVPVFMNKCHSFNYLFEEKVNRVLVYLLALDERFQVSIVAEFQCCGIPLLCVEQWVSVGEGEEPKTSY